jgi:putative membrane protein
VGGVAGPAKKVLTDPSRDAVASTTMGIMSAYVDTGRRRRPGLLGSLIIHFLAEAVAVWAAAALIPGFHVYGGALTYLWIAVLFGVVNAVIGGILRLFTFPLIILTLGLASFLVSVAMLGLTAAISSRLDIDGFWAAVAGAAVVGIVSAVVGALARRLASS